MHRNPDKDEGKHQYVMCIARRLQRIQHYTDSPAGRVYASVAGINVVVAMNQGRGVVTEEVLGWFWPCHIYLSKRANVQ